MPVRRRYSCTTIPISTFVNFKGGVFHKKGHTTPLAFRKWNIALSRFIVLLSGSRFRDLKLLYVNQYFPELFFVGAATAEPEAPVPGRPDYPCGDLDGRKNENTTNGCQNEIK